MSATITTPTDRQPIARETLVAQLTLAASWTAIEQDERDPIDAAGDVLELTAAGRERLRRRAAAALAEAADLTWRERVGLVLHLALTPQRPAGVAA